jgi:hypothetical protein
LYNFCLRPEKQVPKICTGSLENRTQLLAYANFLIQNFNLWLFSSSFRRVDWQTFTDVSEVLAVSNIIAPVAQGASTSKTSVKFLQTTGRNDPEKKPSPYSPP